MAKLTKAVLSFLLAFSLCACSSSSNEETSSTTSTSGSFTDGEYTGSANGNNGPIEVKVVVENGYITLIDVLDHSETAGISDPAFEQIPQAIIDAQSFDVDTVSSATKSSNGIIEAVRNAISGTSEEVATFSYTIDPDVIVVGAGMSGLCAAVRSAELGAKVLVLEQNYRVGGSANTAGGSISGTGYEAQIAAGIEDSPEKFYEDFVTMGGGEQYMNTTIAKVHAENSGAAIDWLKNDVGVEFSDQVDSGGYLTMNTDRVTYTAGGAASGGGLYFVNALSDRLNEFIDSGTVELCLNTMVDDIVLDANGDVVGVVVGEEEVLAPSTIIATGGYGYSEKWLKEFNFTNITSNDPVTAIGSGYDFARHAGAAFDNMDYSSCYGGSVPVSGFQASLRANINYNGVIWVNTSGERMFNEPAATSMDKRTVWRTTDQNIVYLILTQSMIDEGEAAGQNLFTGMMSNSAAFTTEEKIAELLDEGYMFKASSIEDLADQIGTESLVATIEQYNADVASGEDSVFGRTDNLVTFDDDTYYAIYTVPYLMMTAGGPRINENAQLVKEDGTVINGAYLAGEIIGSANIAGHNTIGGIGHGMCATWGKLSAEKAVENAGIK